MLDENLRPYLIEVNQMPSFQTDSDLDYRVKKGVISDCMSILNLGYQRRFYTEQSKTANQLGRLMTKYKVGGKNKGEQLPTMAQDTSVQKHLDE
jgi:hypothetical protein